MKPEILGNINPRASFIPKESIKTADKLLLEHSNFLGSVEPIGLCQDDPHIKALLGFGYKHNLFYRKQEFYTGSCFLPLHGSVGLHDDRGIGHLLCWILRMKDFRGKCPEWGPSLLVLHGGKPLEIRPKCGDVFIFDGNRQHAWFSNESCLLAQTTVGIRRSRSAGSVVS